MVVRISTLHSGTALTSQKNSWYSFLLEAESIPRLEGLGKFKGPMTTSGIESETSTFQLVA
jgi:hypothetical protein